MKIHIALIGTYKAFEAHKYRFGERITYANLTRAYFEVGQFCFYYVRRVDQLQGLHIQSWKAIGHEWDSEMLDALDYAYTRMRPVA